MTNNKMKLGIAMVLIASLSIGLLSIPSKGCNSTDISRKSNNAS
jgi:hypothetical protein